MMAMTAMTAMTDDGSDGTEHGRSEMQDQRRNTLFGTPCKTDGIVSGDSLSTILSCQDDITRWATAWKAGVIRPVWPLLATPSGVCRLTFQTDIAPDELEGVITSACRKALDRTRERLCAGERWLARNRDSSGFDRAYDEYLHLLEQLRLYSLAVGDVTVE